MIFNDISPFGPSPGPQGAEQQKSAVACPIYVSNSHTKFGWISSNGLGDSVTDGRTDGDCNIPDAFFLKKGVGIKTTWNNDGVGLKSVYLFFKCFLLVFNVCINIHEYSNISRKLICI